jgi:diacylglycerol kinase (ATP)
MRAAAIFGPGRSAIDLRPFHKVSAVTWLTDLPPTANDADAILILGGDGTLHRHLRQLVELQLPVLVVPGGSGNDFARALNLGRVRDSLAAWRRFSSGGGNLRSIDLGLITPLMRQPNDEGASSAGCYFCCVGGVGLDGEIARRANLLPRWLRAHGGYALSFLAALFKFAPRAMKISVARAESPDSLVERSSQALVVAAFANAPWYGGGMKIAPHARLDDGKLDICLIASMSKFQLFCLFPTVYFGRHLSLRQIEYFQTESLRLESEQPLDVYADGEFVSRTPVEVSVASGVLPVISA